MALPNLVGKAGQLTLGTPSLTIDIVDFNVNNDGAEIVMEPVNNSSWPMAFRVREGFSVVFTTHDVEKVIESLTKGTLVSTVAWSAAAAKQADGTAQSASTYAGSLDYGFVSSVGNLQSSDGRPASIQFTVTAQLKTDGSNPTVAQAVSGA